MIIVCRGVKSTRLLYSIKSTVTNCTQAQVKVLALKWPSVDISAKSDKKN